VAYAMMAGNATTVADGAITSAKPGPRAEALNYFLPCKNPP
jgi:hypothetical protein